MSSAGSTPRRRWLALALRVVALLREPHARTGDLVTRSYDRIAAGYDSAWTDHMSALSLELVERLAPAPGAECLDLTCGTGFLTAELARRTGRRALGVDRSAGMLAEARARRPECDFVEADVLELLRGRPDRSADVITCGWGLGYSRPRLIVREAARVLRPGGRLGVIDNSLFSLAGVLWASVLTFAECPEALAHAMQVRFLPGAWALSSLLRLSGLRVRGAWGGAKSYLVGSGEEAIARMTKTGAAAGFEFAADAKSSEEVFRRFAQVLEERYRRRDGIPITHRYLAAIGERR